MLENVQKMFDSCKIYKKRIFELWKIVMLIK